MPRPPTAKGFPCKPEDCYVSRHLDGPEYKIYDLMMSAAKKNERGERLFFASVRPWLVNASHQAASTVDATLDRLEAQGWIKNLARRKPDGTLILERKQDGKAKPHVYLMFEHDAWVKDHPASCPHYKLAPDFEEATKHGVKKGEKLTTGALPRNVWPDELRSAVDKLTGEEFCIVSDDESAALAKHTKEVEATLGGPVAATTPGQPEADGYRSTVQNPTQPIRLNTPHTTNRMTAIADEDVQHLGGTPRTPRTSTVPRWKYPRHINPLRQACQFI